MLAAPANAALLQHFDATVSGSVVGNPVTQWMDQSGNGLHAVDNRGDVFYPSTSLSGTGLEGLDFGPARNDLRLLTAANAQALLDFSGAAAGNDGFSLIVACKIDQMPGFNQHIIGTRHTNGNFSLRVDAGGTIRLKLNNNIGTSGSNAVVAGDTIVISLIYEAATGQYTLWESKNDAYTSGTQNINGNYGNGNPLVLGEARTTGSSSDFLRGMVGEVIIYNSVISTAEMLQLQNDLYAKWVEEEQQLPPVPPGPGFPNVNQTAGAMLSSTNTDPVDNNVRTVVLDYINGYLHMATRGLATGSDSNSHQVWDLSDPANPVEVARIGGQRGQHTSSVLLPHYRISNQGNRILNIRDPLNLVYETPPGYLPIDNGSRGLTVLPYQYTGGSNVSIYDARTGQTLSTVSAHGFVGTSTPLGNLLIIAGIRGQSRGFATYDISDPSNPVLLDVIAPNDPIWNDGNPAYEYFIWKHYLVIPNVLGGGTGDDCAFVDFSDPTDLRHVLYMNGDGTYGTGLPGRTRYAQFQDNKMFLGCGIYDMTPLDSDLEPTLLDVHVHDSEYMLPLGNLYVSAENSEQGTIPDFAGPYPMRIFAHQSAPDNNPPAVAYHIPANGAVNQHVKSRIGVVIHETLDYATINETTFRVFPVAGGADVIGTLNAHDKDILTFTPDADLAAGTTYRVQLDGIQDAAGNAMLPYSFDFTTAGAGGPPPIVISQVTYSQYPAPVGSATNLTVSASGGSGTLEYKWDFGDGTPATSWSSGDDTISHTYAAEGHYTVLAQVRDGASQIASMTIVVSALNAHTGPTPTKGSQIIVDDTNRRVWTVNPDNNTVTAIDADTLAKELEVTVSADPRSIAQDATGNLWIACLDDDRTEINEPVNGNLVTYFQCHPGTRPHDITFNNAKTYAYVTLKGSGQLVRIDTATMVSDIVLDTGPTPTALAVTTSGDKVLANRFISPDANGEVRLFDNADNASFALSQVIPLVLDTVSEDTGDSGRGLPNYLADVIIDLDNAYAYVTSKKDNIQRGMALDGNPLTHETTTRSILSKIDLATNTEVFAERIDFDDSSQPTALAFSPHGDFLFMAMQGNNHIKVVDTISNAVTTTLDTGLAPQGVCFDPVTFRLFVKNLNDRSVTVYNLTDGLLVGDFSAPPEATISTVASETFAADVLLGKQIFYNASDLRMSDEGYISCALCHQDGDHDGRTWDFTDRGEGLRNTINLRGRAGMAHGNVHWSANFDEIQDFELDMKNAFAGTGFLSDVGGPNASLGAPNAGRNAELDALAAYVASLGASSIEVSPYKNADGSLTAAAAMGKELFEGTLAPTAGGPLNCYTCHDPATAFTDSTLGDDSAITLHDVGTLTADSGSRLGGPLNGIDTPTLLGVHASAPYFHNGSAATLAEVFDPSRPTAAPGEAGAEHDLSALTVAERDYLIAFLMQLDGAPIIVPVTGPDLILFDDFEAGFGNWTDGGSDALRDTTGGFVNGTAGVINLQDNTSTSVITTGDLALSTYSEIIVEFDFQVFSFENTEDFWLQISTDGGASFTTVKAYVNDVDFVDNGTVYNDETVTISGFTLTDQTRIRFRCDASGNRDDVYLDDISISAQ